MIVEHFFPGGVQEQLNRAKELEYEFLPGFNDVIIIIEKPSMEVHVEHSLITLSNFADEYYNNFIRKMNFKHWWQPFRTSSDDLSSANRVHWSLVFPKTVPTWYQVAQGHTKPIFENWVFYINGVITDKQAYEI